MDRASLTARSIPHMILSTGDASSLTGPPPPIQNTLSSAGRAAHRFQVSGNVIITGGTGTLGIAAARALQEHGASGVVLYDKAPGPAASAEVERLNQAFPSSKISIRVVDITNEDTVNSGVVEDAKTLGSIDHLFCFAGVVGCTNAIDMSPTEWRRTLDINTTGSFICAQAVAKQMIAQGTIGSITFTASISGHRVNYPQPQVAYNVSKSALLTMKNCLAAEWARYGIRVNSISPGYMDTILNDGEGLADTRDVWANRNPMGRMGVPSELQGVVVLLASNAGSYINGTDIVVDGGAIVF